MADRWKVLDLLNATKAFFEKKGIVDARGRGSARLDAELLLAEALECRRIDLYVRFGETVDKTRLARFRELVRRRAERQPVKQILGRCEFMSHEFEISPDVLTPRPETETVVEQALAAVSDGPSLVADIGTGCGNIAISVALARPEATVYATDISGAALAVAGRNVRRHRVSQRVTMLAGDLFAPLTDKDLEGKLDCVVSNPPYVAESEFSGLMPEVARYEPRVALVSDHDGMGHTLRILEAAPGFLRGGGVLVLELSAFTAERARAAAEANDAYDQVRTKRDLNKVERVLVAQKKA